MRWSRLSIVWATILLFAGLALVEWAWAGADVVKHSGTVLAVDQAAGTMVLGEVGPWRLENGVTAITKITVTMPPSTEFSVAIRKDEGDSGYRGGFVEVARERAELRPGDYVTVTCRHEGKRMTALKITAVEPEDLGGR